MKKCLAVQESCQMVCHECQLVWDMNDSDPPACEPCRENITLERVQALLREKGYNYGDDAAENAYVGYLLAKGQL